MTQNIDYNFIVKFSGVYLSYTVIRKLTIELYNENIKFVELFFFI